MTSSMAAPRRDITIPALEAELRVDLNGLSPSCPDNSRRNGIARRWFLPPCRQQSRLIFVQTTPPAVRQTNHMTGDFQDPRLRHSIVMGFVRRYTPGFAQRRRADWPGDSPCPL